MYLIKGFLVYFHRALIPSLAKNVASNHRLDFLCDGGNPGLHLVFRVSAKDVVLGGARVCGVLMLLCRCVCMCLHVHVHVHAKGKMLVIITIYPLQQQM